MRRCNCRYKRLLHLHIERDISTFNSMREFGEKIVGHGTSDVLIVTVLTDPIP